ncbi:ejaculatory bulb-specific protein 3 [Orussus abietinus]|uniref:ejaculatory bulb-specific protein 3 n=1 Tax=Orussus abietinus TaxID=222816 RepID=UPI00062551A1|nr:ejaculatory bulb-specific protein 3 [Orussus abietinus]
MKFSLFVLVAVALVAVSAKPQAETQYTTKFDSIDVDQILQSDRLLEGYFKCLMETGNCTPEGTELKKVLPDALQTECHKCSEKQKANTEKVIAFLTKNKKDLWKQLAAKYDPEGVYQVKYEEKAKTAGIEV